MPTIRWLGLVAVIAGLLLSVRVMFFGVQRRSEGDQLHHRRWPLALGAFLMIAGVAVYARADHMTAAWFAASVLLGLGSAAGAWWWVQRSASLPSSDPEDDPRYRFQGHVARIVDPITSDRDGRISFEYEGKRHDLRARWSPSMQSAAAAEAGTAGMEVVIEIVEGDMAYVEPWALVEERL